MTKKEEIIKIASKEFAKYGYENVSLEKIAKKANITKPAIYYHFKNKLELFEMIVIPKIEKLSEEIYSFENDNPAKELQHYIYSYAKIFKKHPCLNSIMAYEFVTGGKNFSDEIIKNISKIFQKLILILNNGKEKNIFEFDNPFSIQLMIVSSLVMNQPTKELRKRVSKYIDMELNPNIDDIASAIYYKILKAISKDEK